MNTVAIAATGVFAGLLYARYILPEAQGGGALNDELQRRAYALYGTMGAVVAILSVRLGAIVSAILRDYLSKE